MENILRKTSKKREYQQMKIEYEKKESEIIRVQIAAFEKLKDHKSLWSGGIVSEMPVAFGDVWIKIFYKIYQPIWENDTWPEH